MRRVLCHALIALATAVVLPFASAQSSTGVVPASIRDDANWILETRTPEGILANGIDKTWVVPYFANIGATGLARAYALTKDARYITAAWSWLTWYQQHMNGQGFVTDYVYANGSWRSTGSMDSTDSYASTFLVAVREAFAASGDTTKLLSLKSGVSRAAQAIEATTHPDSLTQAAPSWAWRYLMDNAEVYEGWRAAAELAAALGDQTLATHATMRANAIRQSIAVFRATQRGGYDWGHMQSGARATLDWTQLYPSAVSQAWPIYSGLVTGIDAKEIMQRIDQQQPVWDEPYSYGKIVDEQGRVGYWPDVARGFLKAGFMQRATKAYWDLEETAYQHARLWPFHPGIAGSLILLGADLHTANTPPTVTETSHTPASPQAYPISSPMRHDTVSAQATVSDGDDQPVVKICVRDGSTVTCSPMNKTSSTRYQSGALPKKCAGQSFTYWIVAADGERIVTSPQTTVSYQGDRSLNAAFCR